MTLKTIADCQWFGYGGSVTEEQLLGCGCERCQQELLQKAFLADALAVFQERKRG